MFAHIYTVYTVEVIHHFYMYVKINVEQKEIMRYYSVYVDL